MQQRILAVNKVIFSDKRARASGAISRECPMKCITQDLP